MLNRLVDFSTSRPYVIIAMALVFGGFGWTQMRGVPVEAFPDVTNVQVQVITLATGRAAEEVERQVTVPLEHELAGIPETIDMRSISVYGLSEITLTFDDGADLFASRTRVGERLRQVDLPEGLVARLGPESTPVGEVFRYTIESRGLTAIERRGLQDWVVSKALIRVPGVATVVSWGGFQKQYQVAVDPGRLAGRGLGIPDVVEALRRSSSVAGGNYIEHGAEEYVVRGMGYLVDPREITGVALAADEGVPTTIGDIGRVVLGHVPRRGIVGRNHDDEAVEGIVLMRKRSHPAVVLDALHAEVARLNSDVLPRGARIVPYYDRTEMIDQTLATVVHNLLVGAILVILVLVMFLGAWRGPLVVATIIPLALLTAFTGLRTVAMPANVISLGAIDFGILVDGAVIFMETIYHVGATRPDLTRPQVVREAGAQVVRPIVFSLAIIVAALLPVFTMERVEGRIFAPMALTYAFALLGALVWSLTVVPALAVVAVKLPRGGEHAAEPRFVAVLRAGYERAVKFSLRRTGVVAVVVVIALVIAGVMARGLGSEFLPELNEGGMWVTAIFPSSQSLEEGGRLVPRIRETLMTFPEVRDVVSQLGRPEDGSDPDPVNIAQICVSLHPEDQWTSGRDRERLLHDMRAALSDVPGTEFVFSQPIVDEVLESISGIKGTVVIKIFGQNLDRMFDLATRVRDAIAPVRGVKDLGFYRTGTVPQLLIEIDRAAIARYGLRVADVGEVIQSAVGGFVATEIWEDERRVEVAVRVAEPFRVGVDRIREITVNTAGGARVPLGALANIHVGFGRASIQRNQGSRVLAVRFNIEGRDLGSVVSEARERVRRSVPMPEGYSITWGGEFESQQRAMRRLAIIVPAALLIICLLLYGAFGRLRSAVVGLAATPLCLPGAVLALRITHVNLSVSAAVGLIALLGQTVLSAVVVIASINDLRDRGVPRAQAIAEGAARRVRAVLITALLAAFGLLPAALSHAMGSETQRPFALVIVGGVLVATPLLLLALPVLYNWIEKKDALGALVPTEMGESMRP